MRFPFLSLRLVGYSNHKGLCVKKQHANKITLANNFIIAKCIIERLLSFNGTKKNKKKTIKIASDQGSGRAVQCTLDHKPDLCMTRMCFHIVVNYSCAAKRYSNSDTKVIQRTVTPTLSYK